MARSDFAEKVVLVTGAAGGIGRATSASLLALGAIVVAFDASASGLEAAQAKWDAGARVHPIVGDVGTGADVKKAFEVAENIGGQVVGLAACAGIQSQFPVDQLTDEEWRRVLNVNLRGTFLCCQAAARLMVGERMGSIVAMSSSIAYAGIPGRAHYAASKAGIAAFVKALALELAPHGVRANAVAPGSIDTPMPRGLPGRTEEQVQATLRANPLGRVGSANDVAELIVFLLSSSSSHITGQVVHVNGGALRP